MLRPYWMGAALGGASLLIGACSSGSDTGATGTITGTDSVGTFTTSAGSTTGAATDSGSDGSTTDPTAGSASASGTTTGATGSTGDPTDGGSSTGGGGCTTDADCAADPNGPICEMGECVPCTPANDICAEGFYCDPSNTCVPGCLGDMDCPQNLMCDVPNKTCVGCLQDGDCALGTVCDAGACVPGCNANQQCQPGFACCSEQCVDLDTDVNNCGTCDNACALDNATPKCEGGGCLIDTCDNGYEDCNSNDMDGCEIMGTCACQPGAMQACYTGDPNTQGVGVCKDGMQECNANGTGWGACMGEVKPGNEVCANNLDDDCDGMTDEDPDNDNDGWSLCGGDCCDVQGPNCLNPDLVNPGAFEVDGNMVDDDCDGMVDNPVPACDAGLASNSNNPDDYAKAIDLCQFTTENPANPADKIWGVINAQLLRADDTGSPAANSRSIRNGFGSNITNQFGQRLAVMSTGYAADNAGDVNPSFASFQNGQSMGTASNLPADWLALNGGTLPNAPGCPGPSGAANNPVNLKLRVRVPTNAQSFSVDMYFFSAEYPEYVCTAFNDFFVTLVDSGAGNNPADKNIAVYDDGNNLWPVGVNILKAAPGLFTQCSNGQITQCGTPVAYNGCTGTNELVGTGFDIQGATNFSCGYGGRHGGGTGWLNMSGNVSPGETMEIRFIIWDTSDQLFDSLVLLDNWQWSVQASDPGVNPG